MGAGVVIGADLATGGVTTFGSALGTGFDSTGFTGAGAGTGATAGAEGGDVLDFGIAPPETMNCPWLLTEKL